MRRGNVPHDVCTTVTFRSPGRRPSARDANAVGFMRAFARYIRIRGNPASPRYAILNIVDFVNVKTAGDECAPTRSEGVRRLLLHEMAHHVQVH